MVNPDEIFGRLGNRMFQGAYLYSQMRKGEIPDIYVQDEKYFADYKQEVKDLFSQNIPEKTDMIAVHVRRGDYVKNYFYVDLMETDYYERAMQTFVNDYSGNLAESDFLVFSDDIEWCKKQTIFDGCEFSTGKTELEDLNLMASCIGHIIANSSFSWFGAYISPYTRKVIAPKEWYSDGIIRTVIPTEWSQL